ncbi:hypothetical protein BOTBODRAFT_44178 [Botryobasidium botryosum FD-172 SS1]|uniref:Uncharacterized protein n=1 Tax=Botryobasidium botryosum (strain FD-172 SS1) TaxID=930990 RepID=A0A067MKG0_BOTB1|nr:hypothetical protein BOTBODRAFT_44178 [Botryobasidium botryosum FD-172 SS1]
MSSGPGRDGIDSISFSVHGQGSKVPDFRDWYNQNLNGVEHFDASRFQKRIADPWHDYIDAYEATKEDVPLDRNGPQVGKHEQRPKLEVDSATPPAQLVTRLDEWLTALYALAHTGHTGPIPWADIAATPDNFVTSTSFPPNIPIVPPSQLKLSELYVLYEHIVAGEAKNVPLFDFCLPRPTPKAYENNSDSDEELDFSSQSSSPSSSPSRPNPRRIAHRALTPFEDPDDDDSADDATAVKDLHQGPRSAVTQKNQPRPKPRPKFRPRAISAGSDGEDNQGGAGHGGKEGCADKSASKEVLPAPGKADARTDGVNVGADEEDRHTDSIDAGCTGVDAVAAEGDGGVGEDDGGEGEDGEGGDGEGEDGGGVGEDNGGVDDGGVGEDHADSSAPTVTSRAVPAKRRGRKKADEQVTSGANEDEKQGSAMRRTTRSLTASASAESSSNATAVNTTAANAAAPKDTTAKGTAKGKAATAKATAAQPPAAKGGAKRRGRGNTYHGLFML